MQEFFLLKGDIMQELVFDVFFVTALVRHVYTDLQEFLLYDSINISLAVMGFFARLV